MEHQIPQSFKVQWLNTTLKFIKDDTQLIKDYPQMPSSHVEYLHNLIRQRKNDIGLGFKSLYSAVWEAMKIYSTKYQFKIIVDKSEDGQSGHLIMEKIPKLGQPGKELYDEIKLQGRNDEKKDLKNSDERKEKDNETIKKYEVSKQSNTEAVKCKQKDPQPSKKAKSKTPIPKISKGLKMYMENQELLDSLSPLFIKTKLKSILDFISDELCASKNFFNLAPIESRFLENFLSIYQRKNDLDVLLSPACNDIMAEITNCYVDFSKTCRLDISVGVNANTHKREVKYTKVPVFLTKKKEKQNLTENSIKTKATTVTPIDSTKLINKPSINKEQSNITDKKNVSKQIKISNTCTMDTSYFGSKQNGPKMKILQDMSVPLSTGKALSSPENLIKTKITTVTPIDSTKLINKPSINKEQSNITEKKVSKQNKKSTFQILQNIVTLEDRNAKSKPIDKVIETIDNNVIEALSKFVNKSDDFKPKTTTYLKNTSLNKSELLPKKSISFTKQGTLSNIGTSHIGLKQNGPTMKILQDMSVPLTSDKGLRMMQLMGWKGGALGLRGEGITEPIIPIPNFNGSGLGHVTIKTELNKNKDTKNVLRSRFSNKILEMIDNDIKESVIKMQHKLIKKEIRFWKLTIKLINKRMIMDKEFENRFEIEEKMMRNQDIIFNIDFEDDNRKMIIKKSSEAAIQMINRDTEKEITANEINIKSTGNTKSELKTIILKSILELINSDDNEKLVQFNKDMKAKRVRYSNIIILLINEKQYVTHNNNRLVAELGSKVLEAIGDISLSVNIYESERYIVIRKHPPTINNKIINKTVVHSDEKNKNLFDDVRSHLPTRRKHKLLNALYKYEIKDTEEIKEKLWYNTVDKSLLGSEILFNVINHDTKILNNNTIIENYNKNNNHSEEIHENIKKT